MPIPHLGKKKKSKGFFHPIQTTIKYSLTLLDKFCMTRILRGRMKIRSSGFYVKFGLEKKLQIRYIENTLYSVSLKFLPEFNALRTKCTRSATNTN